MPSLWCRTGQSVCIIFLWIYSTKKLFKDFSVRFIFSCGVILCIDRWASIYQSWMWVLNIANMVFLLKITSLVFNLIASNHAPIRILGRVLAFIFNWSSEKFMYVVCLLICWAFCCMISPFPICFLLTNFVRYHWHRSFLEKPALPSWR